MDNLSLRDRAGFLLRDKDAPRVLSAPKAQEYWESKGLSVSLPFAVRLFQIWSKTGELTPVRRGIFLNMRSPSTPNIAEAARHIRTGAIVSLQTVLGRSGVHNNPTPWITCVVPTTTAGRRGAAGEVVSQTGTLFSFSSISEALVPKPGDRWFRDSFQTYAKYPVATPEKALLDIIYLGSHSNSKVSLPAIVDIDWDEIDEDRMERLASFMNLEEAYSEYRKGSPIVISNLKKTKPKAP